MTAFQSEILKCQCRRRYRWGYYKTDFKKTLLMIGLGEDFLWTQMIWHDIFVNCSWVVIRWQKYSTHLHKKTIHRKTQITKLEECRPCLVFASFTLAFALHLRKKHGKTSVRVQYTYTRCPRRDVPEFGRMFLMLKCTDITQNTYI